MAGTVRAPDGTAGQTVLIHGAAGGVGSIAVQLAREAEARVIGTGRATHRQTVLDLGADIFVDLDHDRLDDIGEVDLVLDVIGGEILRIAQRHWSAGRCTS